MKILAWVFLALQGIAICLYPFVFGKSRGVYDATKWLGEILGGAMLTALCGRVLGWW